MISPLRGARASPFARPERPGSAETVTEGQMPSRRQTLAAVAAALTIPLVPVVATAQADLIAAAEAA